MTMLAREEAAANPLDRLADASLSVGTNFYGRFAVRIGTAAFGLYVLLVAATAIIMPYANWDMIPYLAVAEENRFPDARQLHDYAYSTIKAGVTAEQYAALTTNDPYRVHMAADPEAFRSMLSMYRIKFLYAETLSALSHVMSPVAAIRAVAVFSALAFGGIVLLWLHAEGALALAPLVGAVMIVAGFSDAARIGTPDLLASVAMLGGTFAYARKREAAAALLLFLAYLIRPDNLAFLGVFAVLLLAFRQWSWGAFSAFVAAIATYIPIAHWAGHPGWWPHLYFSSIGQQMTMDNFHPAFSLVLYLKAFANAAVRAVTQETWVGVSILALGAWYVSDRAGFRLGRRAGILFAALVLGTLAKFVVFPIHDTRIYLPALIPPFLLLAPVMMAFCRAARDGLRPEAAKARRVLP
jgi:hypothetical protein